MLKRSMTIAGHRTSIALEPEFWDALEQLAISRGLSVANLIAVIVRERQTPNLSSALRVAVLRAPPLGEVDDAVAVSHGRLLSKGLTLIPYGVYGAMGQSPEGVAPAMSNVGWRTCTS